MQVQLEERQAFMEDFMGQSAAFEIARTEGVDEGATNEATNQVGLSQQREALEEERRRFTEAAVKLGKDRMELEVRSTVLSFNFACQHHH